MTRSTGGEPVVAADVAAEAEPSGGHSDVRPVPPGYRIPIRVEAVRQPPLVPGDQCRQAGDGWLLVAVTVSASISGCGKASGSRACVWLARSLGLEFGSGLRVDAGARLGCPGRSGGLAGPGGIHELGREVVVGVGYLEPALAADAGLVGAVGAVGGTVAFVADCLVQHGQDELLLVGRGRDTVRRGRLGAPFGSRRGAPRACGLAPCQAVPCCRGWSLPGLRADLGAWPRAWWPV